MKLNLAFMPSFSWKAEQTMGWGFPCQLALM